jgi:hypothetical protein
MEGAENEDFCNTTAYTRENILTISEFKTETPDMQTKKQTPGIPAMSLCMSQTPESQTHFIDFSQHNALRLGLFHAPSASVAPLDTPATAGPSHDLAGVIRALSRFALGKRRFLHPHDYEIVFFRTHVSR